MPCRRGWDCWAAGERADHQLPEPAGPGVHAILAISRAGCRALARKASAFEGADPGSNVVWAYKATTGAVRRIFQGPNLENPLSLIP